VVEQNLAHLMEAQSSFRDKFINFDEDLNMMKVDFASSRASTSVSSEVA
jgi:hypothetical protein